MPFGVQWRMLPRPTTTPCVEYTNKDGASWNGPFYLKQCAKPPAVKGAGRHLTLSRTHVVPL